MKKLIKFFLLLLLIAGVEHPLLASHLMGGEITWECIKTGPNAGRFQFRVKLYRDCNGIPGPMTVTLETNAPGFQGSGILCTAINQNDISPTGPGCPTCANPMGLANAVEEFVYQSNPIFITGTPPPGGWYFFYEDCCRNAAITNLSAAGNGNFVLRAMMYPYNATNTNPCFDSSPQFAEKPQLSTCTRNLTTYNHNAIDVETDSLVYDWGNPLQGGFPPGPGAPYPFNGGYSATSPLPGPAQNVNNLAANMNSNTGAVSFLSYTPGAFVTVTKVTAYKCGIKVAEIFREIQIALLNNCIISNPPGGPTVYNTPPDVQDLLGNPLNAIFDTVYAGDTVDITLIAFDFEALPTGGPQSLSLSASGSQFGTNFTNSSAGCPFPPCATLDPPWIDSIPPINTVFNPLNLQTRFQWVTDCNHLPRTLGCLNLSNTYNFVLKVYDNFCPSPSVNFNTLSITVLAPPPVQAARMKCASVNPDGSVQLTFLPPVDVGTPDTNQFFKMFYIYRSLTGAGGPFVLLDSMDGFKITNYDTVLTYLDNDGLVNANNGVASYYLTTRSGCDLEPRTVSDIISTMFLQVAQVGTNASLAWTPIRTPLPSSSTRTYEVFREQPPAGSGNWVSIGTTSNLTFLDPITVCDDSINYRVQIQDTSAANCVSISNIDGARLIAATPNITSPSLRSTAVLANGSVDLCWVGSIDTGQFFSNYTIYRSANLAGPYVNIGTVSNYAQNSFNDATANGNNQVNYYYVTTTAGCDAVNTFESDQTPSDTLANMILTASNATLGFATLNWNPISTPLPGTSTGQYQIYRRSPPGAGPWVLAGTSPTTTYQDPITDCDTPVEYRVEIGDNGSTCNSISSDDDDIFTYIGDIIQNPEIRCLSVDDVTGDVQISWQAPADPTGFFASIQIYHSTNAAGPYNLVTTINNIATTTYTHPGTTANNQVNYYYLRSLSGCDGTRFNGSSDTLATMLLNVNNANLGFADLTWNAMHQPMLPSAGPQYRILRRPTGIGAYVQIGTTAATTYSDPITDCNIPYEYIVELDDNLPCISRSSAADGIFTYLGNLVAHPDLRCVSVTPTGEIELTWIAPSGSTVDFNEYEIYRNSGAGFVLIDSVEVLGQTLYLDATANGNTQSYSYYIRSQSGCSGQVYQAGNSNTINSIFVTTTGVPGQANISWNSHPIQPGSSPIGYDVWSSYPSGVGLITILSTLQLTASESISDCDTTLLHQVSLADQLVGCVSYSNVDTNSFTYLGNVIDHPELRCASVGPAGEITLSWENPAPVFWQNFNQYNVWRNTGGVFTLIDSVDNFASTNYLDLTANGNSGPVQYYLQTLSGCTGQVTPAAIGGPNTGNTISTIFLNVTGGNTTTANLSWNPVSTPALPTATGTYTIEKEQPAGSGNWTVVANNVNTTNWQENLVLCIEDINYRVSTGDNQPCTSLSNVDGDQFVDHTVPDPPSIRCASVLPNGNVDIRWTWVPPVDTGQRFANYTIYTSTSPAGPFVPASVINNFATNNFTDAGVNAQAASQYYYMTTQTACGGEISPGSDTLQTIKTDVLNANGVAVISWNPLHSPELTTATQSYTVYKEYPTGVWTILGNTTAPTYQLFDTINVCEATINYRVETGDADLGCTSSGSVDGDLFRDITRPTVNLLDTVSLDPFNPSQVSISWLPSPSGDVVGYIIYIFNGASWDSVGGINNASVSSFIHNNPAAEFGSQRYSIAAFDSCGNVSNIGVSHNTLFTTADLDVCRGAIDVRWNPYLNMPGGTLQYNIYASENSGPFNLIGSVPGNSVSFSHTGLNDGSTYCYYVQAQGNLATRTASSNQACELAELLELPDFSYLITATVIDERRVVVKCLVDTAGDPDVSKYKLQRAFEKNGPFTTVGAVLHTGQPNITINDFSARTNEYSYYYRVVTIDSCGNEVLISNVGRTILLTGKPDFNLVNDLNWNFYEEWLGGVNSYSIFRSVDGVWAPTPLATITNGVLEYADDVSELFLYPLYYGKFCYRVEAYEGPGNTYGFSDTSSSNIFCLTQEPHLFIPSAFTPGGKNSIFKPEFIYINPKNYYFIVMNRWGQKVYETRIPGEGWDGTYNGSYAPEGTYVYTVRIFGSNGKEVEKSGTVTILR